MGRTAQRGLRHSHEERNGVTTPTRCRGTFKPWGRPCLEALDYVSARAYILTQKVDQCATVWEMELWKVATACPHVRVLQRVLLVLGPNLDHAVTSAIPHVLV